MKVYNLKDGSSKEHHPVDAREIVREQPGEYSLQNPKDGSGESAAAVDTSAAAETARQTEAARKQLAEEQATRGALIVEAKKAAVKARDAAEEAARINNGTSASPAAKKKETQAAADAAEKAADEADSELARLEAGGEPSQKVVLK